MAVPLPLGDFARFGSHVVRGTPESLPGSGEASHFSQLLALSDQASKSGEIAYVEKRSSKMSNDQPQWLQKIAGVMMADDCSPAMRGEWAE